MIYFIQAGENGPIKIGRSNDVEKRLKQLQTASAEKLKILWVYDADNDKETEIELHEELKSERINGEWFKPSEQVFFIINNHCDDLRLIDFFNSDTSINLIERLGIISFQILSRDQRYSFDLNTNTGELILNGNNNSTHKNDIDF